MKRLTTLIALILTAIILTAGNANATDDDYPLDDPTICTDLVIDQPAYDEVITDAHWQRYSWTGGPHDPDTAPTFPSDDWQPNVKGDPHQVGVAGAYWRSNGNAGNGDWFFLEWVPAEVIHHDATYKLVEVPCGECPRVSGEPRSEDECGPVPKPRPTPTDPADPATPAGDVNPPAADQMLPNTGGGDLWGVLAGGVLAAAGVAVLRRARRV